MASASPRLTGLATAFRPATTPPGSTGYADATFEWRPGKGQEADRAAAAIAATLIGDAATVGADTPHPPALARNGGREVALDGERA